MTDELTAVKKHVEALNRKLNSAVDRIEDLERENAELRRQVAALQGEVDPDPGSKEYSDLSRAEKVRQIRERLVDVAGADHNGTAAMKYKDVMWLFDGHPSAGHCYDLMERAGQLDGFDYSAAGGGKGDKRVTVNLDAVKDESLVHGVNKAVEA